MPFEKKIAKLTDTKIVQLFKKCIITFDNQPSKPNSKPLSLRKVIKCFHFS